MGKPAEEISLDQLQQLIEIDQQNRKVVATLGEKELQNQTPEQEIEKQPEMQ